VVVDPRLVEGPSALPLGEVALELRVRIEETWYKVSEKVCRRALNRFKFPVSVLYITDVTREQAGRLNADTCITILPEVPLLEQQAIPRAAIPNFS